MNALKRFIVLRVVFFFGFSFLAFGKITHQGTTTETLNITINNNRKTAKTVLKPIFAKLEPVDLFDLFLKTWTNILNGTVQQTPVKSAIRDQKAKRFHLKKVKTRLVLIIPVLEESII